MPRDYEMTPEEARIRRDRGEEPSTFRSFWKCINRKQLEIDRERQINRCLVKALEFYAGEHGDRAREALKRGQRGIV